MKVVITGACGFVGRAVVAALEDRHDLRLVDQKRPEDATMFVPGGERVPAPLLTSAPFIQAAVTDEVAMLAAMEGMDAVIHLAGEPRGLPELGVDIFRANALGTFVVLDAARKAGVSRALCASSINAFGTFYWRISGNPVEHTALPLTEDATPVPEDPYSLSKLVNEESCAAFSRAYGMTTAAFRFAVVYSQTRLLAERAAAEPTAAWNDDLFQWVHVDDVADGLTRALEHPDLPRHGVYSIGAADTRCPEPTLKLLQRFRPDLLTRLTRPLSGREALLDIGRARAAFGYAPSRRLHG